MVEEIGLICEDGGTRAAYICGILQCSPDYDIEFPYAIGINVGIEVLLPLVARQKGRLHVTEMDATCESGAIDVSPLIYEKGMFGIGYICKFIKKHAPLDYEAFMNNKTLLDIGVYNMNTNEVEYFPKEYFDPEEWTPIQASYALSLLTRPCESRGHMYMDAGLVDMIPTEQST